jgi:hypothetical protein
MMSIWQCDWESESYVQLIRHVVNLQGVKTREAQEDRQIKIRERLLAIILPWLVYAKYVFVPC